MKPRRPTSPKHGRAVRLDALSTEPPTAFLLFKLGTNDTENGTFYLTAADARACVKAHEAYGNDLSIDYGHGVTNEDDGQPRRAAGWIGGLEARPDGLWATRVTWTALAAQLIRNREQRFTSPYFLTDEKNHITQIINCALTMIPATRDLVPLVAHRQLRRRAGMAKMCSAENVHAHADKLGELAEAMDSAKLKKLSEDMHAMASAGKDVPDAAEDEGAKKKASEEIAAEAVAASSDVAAPDGAAVVAEALAALSALARDPAPADEPAAPVAASRGGSSEEDAELGRVAREVTGKASASEVRGVLLALEQSRGEQRKLLGRVAELEQRVRRADVAEVVRLATKAGKLRLSQRDWAIRLGMADVESLKAFIEETPAVPTKGTEARAASSEEEALKRVALSVDEEKMLKVTGVKREDYLAAKARAQAASLGDRA